MDHDSKHWEFKIRGFVEALLAVLSHAGRWEVGEGGGGEGEHGELILSGTQHFDNDSNLFIAFHPLTVITLAIIEVEITFSTQILGYP